MKNLILVTLAILSLVSCDDKLKVIPEKTQEIEIPGLGLVKRFTVRTGYGTDYIYYIDRSQPITVNQPEGKHRKSVVIIDGVTYEAK